MKRGLDDPVAVVGEGEEVLVALLKAWREGTKEDGTTGTVEGGVVAEPPIDDLFARAKDGKLDLVWTPVAAATGYDVYRSTTPGGPYDLIASNHQCDYCVYADFGLTNGTTYHYVVVWRIGGVESEASNEASATPQARRRNR